MLGMRGCRLGIQHPSVTAMQSRAIFEAAKACADKGIRVKPQIMVPLVAAAAEFSHQANVIRDVYAEIFAGAEAVPFEIGGMVETPRAALVSDTLVRAGAQFLSLGTNDLTQMTFGFSRDDVGPILDAMDEGTALAPGWWQSAGLRSWPTLDPEVTPAWIIGLGALALIALLWKPPQGRRGPLLWSLLIEFIQPTTLGRVK